MELRLPAPCLIVLIGPSGAGKTTWARNQFTEHEVVSSDRLRAMVGIDEDDQQAGTAAFRLLESIVAERVRRGLNTVIDTTGLDQEGRRSWIATAHSAGMPAHAIVFDTPRELCEQRNASKTRPIPKNVMSRQFSRFRTALAELDSDGFDGVHREQPVGLVTSGVAEAVATAASVGRPATGHRFGLLVSRFDWDNTNVGETLAAVALRAEAAGFRDIWLMDHFRQIRGVGRKWEDIPEVYTALSFIASATSSIRLGALVTGVTHRNPVVLGKMLATLDVLSAGRVICGLGIGWDADEHRAYGIPFPQTSERYRLLEETLEMLPLLWGPGSPEFRGEAISADELICYPRPFQDPIPIMLGGSGEKRTLRLVAQYADMSNLFGDPATIKRKVDVLHRHCEDVGRDPADVEVTHLTTALVAGSRSELRERIDLLRDRNTSHEEYAGRNNAGTVDDLTGLFTAYAAAGADHSIVSLPDVHLEGSIEEFGEIIETLGHS